MDLGSITADPGSLIFQIAVTLLFGLVFLFLWRQSKIVYFGLWSAAWAVQAVALPLGYVYAVRRSLPWLAAYALMEFAFAVLLFAAGRAGFSGSIRDWRAPLRILLGFPIFVALVYTLGWHTRQESVHALHAVVLCSVYTYNSTSIRTIGVGGGVFRFSLLCLAVVFLYHAIVVAYLSMGAVPAEGWLRVLQYSRFYDFALHAVLTFAALAMWIESQQHRVKEMAIELERVRRESTEHLETDDLTGLLNHAALDRHIRERTDFTGVVVVCDMDNFKDINDSYGHLTGDEILRSIGHLLRSSIRQADLAFRWGGDEFVILFHNADRELINGRMAELQERLRTFRVRGYGVLPISFSWGTAEANGRPLRDALNEADRTMYQHKGTRRT
jgi:diguanylate cyclase (GGDEF)-like protein